MEIAPNVHRVTVGQGAFVGVYAPNVYLVVGRERAAFIDTAYGKADEAKAQLEAWESLGKPKVGAIILTHRHGDHTGGAARLREATGGEIVTSTAEREAIEESLAGVRVGRAVADGETLDLGGATLEFLHTPGHTVGSMCVLHRQGGFLFTGDTILGSGTTVISPDHGDMGDYLKSLERLLRCELGAIYPGHGPVVNQPRAKIQELIAHRLDRERQVLDLLKGESRTVDELLGAIYPELDRRLHDPARNQIRSHLIKLEREGKVEQASDGGYKVK